MIPRRRRLLLAVGVALAAVGVIGGPASAETVLIACDGTCADHEVYDSPKPPPYGANCKFETTGYVLDWISARPPQMHGLATYPKTSKVEWRMKVLHAPDALGTYNTIYKSGWQGAYANDQDVARAGDGFRRIRWYAPESPDGAFKVWVEMRWWKGGEVRGTARVEYDSYKWLWNGMTGSSPNWCDWAVG